MKSTLETTINYIKNDIFFPTTYSYKLVETLKPTMAQCPIYYENTQLHTKEEMNPTSY